MDIVDGRGGPGAQPRLEQRLHGNLGGAAEHRCEPFVLRVFAQRTRGRDVDRKDQLAVEGARRGDREIVHRRAVDEVAAADIVRRQVAGERAGGEHRVAHGDVVEPRQAPQHLHAGVDVDGVHDDGNVEVLEGRRPDEALDQVRQRLAAKQGGGAHALQGHVGMGDLKDILALQIDRDVLQLRDALPGGPGGTDQRPDAAAHDVGRLQAALQERLEHADVRESFHAAAPEDEGKASAGSHCLVPLDLGLESRVT